MSSCRTFIWQNHGLKPTSQFYARRSKQVILLQARWGGGGMSEKAEASALFWSQAGWYCRQGRACQPPRHMQVSGLWDTFPPSPLERLLKAVTFPCCLSQVFARPCSAQSLCWKSATALMAWGFVPVAPRVSVARSPGSLLICAVVPHFYVRWLLSLFRWKSFEVLHWPYVIVAYLINSPVRTNFERYPLRIKLRVLCVCARTQVHV